MEPVAVVILDGEELPTTFCNYPNVTIIDFKLLYSESVELNFDMLYLRQQ